MLKSLYIKSQVTCCKILSHDEVLYATGNCLNKLNLSDNKRSVYKKFDSCFRIHSIKLLNDRCTFLLAGKQFFVIDDFDAVAEYKANFWIHDAIVSNGLLILCGMHNFLDVLPYNSVLDLSMSKRIYCHEKCMLYSALLIESTASSIIVAAGTVFNETILWDGSNGEVLHRLKGHDGVIFSITYSQPLAMIATTSDDRTARLYKINAVDGATAVNWKTDTITPYKVLYGHTARVWRCHLLSNVCLTAGEDGVLCAWNYDGTLRKKLHAPSHASLWCLDVVDDDDNIVTCVSGDAASSVVRWNVHYGDKSALPVSKSVDVAGKATSVKLLGSTTTVLVTTDVEKDKKGDRFQQLVAVSEGVILDVVTLVPLKEICVGFKEFVAVAAHDGNAILLRLCQQKKKFERLSTIKLEASIIRIHFVGADNSISELLMPMVACSLTSGRIAVHCGTQLSQLASFELPKSKHRWCTTIVTLEDNFIVGDGSGNVHQYIKEFPEPKTSLVDIHGMHGVTGMITHGVDQLLTCGRNGRVCLLGLVSGLLVHLRNVWISAEVQWLSGLYRLGECTLLTAFHANKFVTARLGEESNLLEFQCGGGHRSWDFHVDQTAKKCSLYYVSRGRVYIEESSLQKLAVEALTEISHCRKINTIASLGRVGDSSYFATGGEDNVIMLWKMSKLGETHGSPLKLYGHISSVRSIAWCDRGQIGSVMVSVGGRAQMVAWNVDLNSGSESSEELCVREMINCVVVMKNSIDGSRRVDWSDSSELWPRLLDVAIRKVNSDDEVFELVIVASDGILRRFLYETPSHLEVSSRGRLRLVDEITMETRLSMKIMIKFDAEWILHGNGSLEVIRESDGIIRNVHNFKLVVTCMDIVERDKDHYVLCTGGDDGQLRVIVADKSTLELRQVFETEEAHGTQVTGIKFSKDNNCLVSCSIDQRLCVWKLSSDNKLKYVATKTSCIPDISCLEITDNFVIVGGIGYEVFNLLL